jgi:ribosomal protein S18 acetylase RimI-like enzyme
MIREMNPKDIDKVSALYLEANHFTNKRTIKDWTKKDYTKYPKLHLVFEKNKLLEGAISGTINNGVGEIQNFAVKKTLRNQHIGTKLINELEKRFKKLKLKKIILWVDWESAAAIPFYHKKGYTITKTIKNKNIKDVPIREEIIYMHKML